MHWNGLCKIRRRRGQNKDNDIDRQKTCLRFVRFSKCQRTLTEKTNCGRKVRKCATETWVRYGSTNGMYMNMCINKTSIWQRKSGTRTADSNGMSVMVQKVRTPADGCVFECLHFIALRWFCMFELHVIKLLFLLQMQNSHTEMEGISVGWLHGSCSETPDWPQLLHYAHCCDKQMDMVHFFTANLCCSRVIKC